MAAADTKTVLPSPTDVEIARASVRRLASLVQVGRPVVLRPRDEGQEEPIELPDGAVELLVDILDDMASGRAVTIGARSNELTTQQAAEFLNVSRPFLIRLLEEGKIPFRMVGSHRRVRFEDAARYKEATDIERQKVLDELAAEAQKLGMGY